MYRRFIILTGGNREVAGSSVSIIFIEGQSFGFELIIIGSGKSGVNF